MTPVLALDDIDCTFTSREDASLRYTAVRGATLRIAKGEFVSGAGPTGCGKSTLLNVAAGLLRPSAGSVPEFGQPLPRAHFPAGASFPTGAPQPSPDPLP